MPEDKSQVILRCEKLCKYFKGVKALESADLDFKKGEIHALVGQNGAGKSTLIKLLTGAYQKTSGEIYFEGREIDNFTPKGMEELGIHAVYQELTLFPELSIEENIFMGKELKRKFMGVSRKKKMMRRTQELLDMIQLKEAPSTLVKDLSIAKQQMVEIARSMCFNLKLLIMDEPTSSLTQNEITVLFELVKALRDRGITIIFISHHMEEIFQICDRATIMRDGRIIKTMNVSDIDGVSELVELMVNRDIGDFFPAGNAVIGETVLKVNELSRSGVFSDISFEVRKGEIFGIGGLVGSKRTELIESIFGVTKPTSGKVLFNGTDVTGQRIEEAIKRGFAFISEDRKTKGIIRTMSVGHNISLVKLRDYLGKGKFMLKKKKEISDVTQAISKFDVKTASIHSYIDELSGGNQQKAILARWLVKDSELLLMDEPTRGISVDSKAQIYQWLRTLTENGLTIIFVSSENDELIGMCDRIMVMKDGHVSGFIDDKQEMNDKNILKLMFGGDTDEQAS